MSGNLKFELKFKDRIGLVFDVARLMTEQSLNIVTMELQQKQGLATISLEIEKPDYPFDGSVLLELFPALSGIREWRKILWLPHETREEWFRTLFDGMSEGIISVDENGRINTINSVACNIFGLIYEQVIGSHISELALENSILFECLEKGIQVSRRKSVITNRGRIEFYGSAKPITDSSGNRVGAVLLLQDLKEVKEMVDAVSRPLQVTFDDFIGQSPVVRNLIQFARKIADTDAIISITGESGTGKELFARAIHFESSRPGPFIPINCAAIPESLIESELFGYAHGAFTGARKKGKPGLFEAAGGGTIFLDEIGDMPHGPQAKILRVLQEGVVRRIGGYEEIPVNARVITATNMDLKKLIREKRFREDLYYRINGFTIQIPPLRERLIDIPLLAAAFLHRFNTRLGKKDQVLSKAALAKLLKYTWPGNVRELKSVIERGAILSDSDLVEVDSILISSEVDTFVHRDDGLSFQNDGGLKSLMGQYEMQIIVESLNRARSIRQAARELKISHTALIRKIAKYKLKKGDKGFQWN